MKIDGKQLANEILKSCSGAIYGSKNNPPTLAVIFVGDNPASLSYIKQKQKAAESIKTNLFLKKFPSSISQISLISQINQINSDPKIHGLIVQKPLSPQINSATIAQVIAQSKDIDGFHPNSPFTPPIASAVLKILDYIYVIARNPERSRRTTKQSRGFQEWLKSQNILVLGRGETGGKPIADTLKKMNIKFEVASSQTKNTNELLKKSDIIISCIGKPNFIKGDMIKKGSICIGVGVSRKSVIASPKLIGTKQSQYKLVGDFEEDSISKVVSFYTPTPGGVGPVNVACLMQNLIKAWKIFRN